MNITVSYDLAAFNIAQEVKFKEDINPKEARLGAWKFSHSLYYVCSSDNKIAKLWFDFLKLIGLIVEAKDPKFAQVLNASGDKFGKMEHTFNTQKYEDFNKEKQELAGIITKLSQRLIKRKGHLNDRKNQIQQLTQDKAALSKQTENLVKENNSFLKQLDEMRKKNEEYLATSKTLTDDVNKLTGDLAFASGSIKTLSYELLKQKQNLVAVHSAELEDKDHKLAELKSQIDSLNGEAQKNQDAAKKSLQEQLALKDKSITEKEQICKNLQMKAEALQTDKTHLQEKLTAKEEQIKSLKQENSALQSEKKHNEKQHQDHGLQLVKLKDEHTRQLKKYDLDTQDFKVKYEKAEMAIEEKDNKIKQLEAQIEALKSNSAKGEGAAQ